MVAETIASSYCTDPRRAARLSGLENTGMADPPKVTTNPSILTWLDVLDHSVYVRVLGKHGCIVEQFYDDHKQFADVTSFIAIYFFSLPLLSGVVFGRECGSGFCCTLTRDTFSTLILRFHLKSLLPALLALFTGGSGFFAYDLCSGSEPSSSLSLLCEFCCCRTTPGVELTTTATFTGLWNHTKNR